MRSKNTGCGKPYYDEESGEGTFCNEFNGLCPSCSKSEETSPRERQRKSSDNKSPQADSKNKSLVSSIPGDTFNLSDKILTRCHGIPTKDVKTFIKKDMLLICKFLNKDISEKEFWDERDKLTGRKLVE